MSYYSLTIQFPTPPLLATRWFLFLSFFFLFFTSREEHSTPTLPTLFTINDSLFFQSFGLHEILIFLSISGSQIHYLSLQYHHQFLSFLSFSLKICRYHSKKLISTPSMNIQSFSLSQAQPILRKKTLLQQSVLTINRSEEKRRFLLQKNSIADLFQQFYKTGSTSGFSGSQVEPAGFYCFPVFNIFSVFYHNRTGLKAGSRLNRSDQSVRSSF